MTQPVYYSPDSSLADSPPERDTGGIWPQRREGRVPYDPSGVYPSNSLEHMQREQDAFAARQRWEEERSQRTVLQMQGVVGARLPAAVVDGLNRAQSAYQEAQRQYQEAAQRLQLHAQHQPIGADAVRSWAHERSDLRSEVEAFQLQAQQALQALQAAQGQFQAAARQVVAQMQAEKERAIADWRREKEAEISRLHAQLGEAQRRAQEEYQEHMRELDRIQAFERF